MVNKVGAQNNSSFETSFVFLSVYLKIKIKITAQSFFRYIYVFAETIRCGPFVFIVMAYSLVNK